MNWVRSTKCDNGQCVEVCQVGEVGPTVGVRNSRHPDLVVWFDQDEWAAFTAGVRAGEFGLDAVA